MTALVCMLLSVAAPVQSQPRETVPVDGKAFSAELVAVHADWHLSLRDGNRRRELAAAELVRWGHPAETTRGPVVVLADGGLLVADVLQADQDKLTVDADLFGLVELPAHRVAAVVFRLPADRHARDLLLDRARSGTGHGDLVILANGDEIAGRFGRIREDILDVATDVGPVEINVGRVRAVVFDPSLLVVPPSGGEDRLKPELRAVAGLADGSRLLADRLVVEGQSLEITTLGRVTWKTAADQLVCLVPLGGNVTYLSDLHPAGARQIPYLGMLPWRPVREDRNTNGGQLRSGGVLYLKGLGVHSAARVTYLLTEPFRRFDAKLGIDDRTKGRGSVRFRVYVDGRQEYASPVVRGATTPVPVSVDLTGAKRLDLIVDYADRVDEQDHADWLEARLVR